GGSGRGIGRALPSLRCACAVVVGIRSERLLQLVDGPIERGEAEHRDGRLRYSISETRIKANSVMSGYADGLSSTRACARCLGRLPIAWLERALATRRPCRRPPPSARLVTSLRCAEAEELDVRVARVGSGDLRVAFVI